MLLEIEDLHSSYDGSRVIRGVNLGVDRNQVVVLLGRNGMGKTTLIRSVMQLHPPEVTQGHTRFDDESLTELPSHEIARRGLALVPQGRRIFSSLTVEENLNLAHRPPRTPNGETRWNLERVYETFPRLEERRNNRGSQLSGGEQQMLAIGRALMTNPRLLLMDEPSEGLAPMIVQQLRNRIQSLAKESLSILLVEQNLGLALAVADHVYILERGEIVFDGEPSTVRENEELQRQYLGV